MTPPNKKARATAQPTERRSGIDRRKEDKGPPSGRERRVGMEPRKPEIQEIDLTPSEWAALEDQVRIEPKKS
mgnify:CR=1 FL=1